MKTTHPDVPHRADLVPIHAAIRRLREARKRAEKELLRAIPVEAFDDIDEALDIDPDDVELNADAYLGCCLLEWRDHEGRSPLEVFAAGRPDGDPAAPYVEALARSRCVLMRVDEIFPGAGVRATDLQRDEGLFIVDEALPEPGTPAGGHFVGRLLPVGDHWINDCDPMPLEMSDTALRVILEDPGFLALDARWKRLVLYGLAFACALEAEESFDEDWDDLPDEDPLDDDEVAAWAHEVPPPRPPGRNEPCTCGSGKKYKRCCGG